jgi:hypothetical protein
MHVANVGVVLRGLRSLRPVFEQVPQTFILQNLGGSLGFELNAIKVGKVISSPCPVALDLNQESAYSLSSYYEC